MKFNIAISFWVTTTSKTKMKTSPKVNAACEDTYQLGALIIIIR